MTPLRARLRRIRPQRLRKPFVAAAITALALSLTFLTIRNTSKGATGSTGLSILGGPSSGRAAVALDGPGLSGSFAYDRAKLLRSGSREIAAELRLRAKAAGEAEERSPIAMAIVIDTSGSMAGEKILETRKAVASLLESMRDEDRVAIIGYSSHASVLQALDTLASARHRLPAIVDSLIAAGGTNIPGGLEAGAQALALAPPTWVRRMVLISDGNDGSGIALETLCSDLRRRARNGTTLSSIGIGMDYSESYMTSVADAGNGNYVFLADGSSLAPFLRRELEEASASAVDQAMAELTLPSGWNVESVHGADYEIRGRRVAIPLGAIRAEQDRRATLFLRAEADAGATLQTPSLTIAYRTTYDDERHELDADPIALRLVADPAEVEASVDIDVLASTGAARIEAQQALALEAWQRGDLARAQAQSAQAVAEAKTLQAKTKSEAVNALTGLLDREARVLAAPAAPESEEKVRAFGAARRSRARTSNADYANQGLQ